MSLPRIEICSIRSIEEALLAIRSGAPALGLVSEIPRSPGVISENEIAHIARARPSGIATFFLTSKRAASERVNQHDRSRTNAIQIVDSFADGTYTELRDALPGISVVPVIRIDGEASSEEATRIAPHVDALLLNSGNQSLPVNEFGGTG